MGRQLMIQSTQVSDLEARKLKQNSLMHKKMDVASSFPLFLMVVLIGLSSIAFANESMDDIEEDSWDEIGSEDYIEKRYMSNNQIRNKFIIQNNRLAHITKTLDRLENSDSTDVGATQKRIDAAEVDVKDI